jgi:3-oxoacyl-[acyl-carrier-protein] synthase II
MSDTEDDTIAVTGIGLVTSLGENATSTFEMLCAGRSGLKPLQHLDGTRFRAQSAYELSKGKSSSSGPWRASELLVKAVVEAVDSCGVQNKPRTVPCFVGTGLGELRSVELWWSEGTSLIPDRLQFGPALREAVPAVGHVDTITNACSASLFALAIGADAVRLREAERVIVGGIDVLTESMFGLLDRVQITPPDRVRPFDRDRAGVLMGEGAAAVVIERRETARDRGATIYGALRGIGLSCDAHHETAPIAAGMERAIRTALTEAGSAPNTLGFIMAHGTGTLLNDKAEYAALQAVLGNALGTIPVTGIKSMTGHTSGASGLVGLITAMLALAEGRVPPTLGHETPMVEAEAADIITTARPTDDRIRALVNAFGFGGVNASVLVEREVT